MIRARSEITDTEFAKVVRHCGGASGLQIDASPLQHSFARIVDAAGNGPPRLLSRSRRAVKKVKAERKKKKWKGPGDQYKPPVCIVEWFVQVLFPFVDLWSSF